MRAYTLLLCTALASCIGGEKVEERYEGQVAGDCTDLADNDADGAFDCADAGCAASPECAEEVDVDTDTDSDTDTDTDTDSDTDTDTDTDSDTDTDTDTDTDADRDHDGYTDDVDCDDADSGVHPGADEVCGDGVDNDCDGSASACRAAGEVDVTSADLALEGEETSAGVGYFALGDYDGDGQPDVAVASTEVDPKGNASGAVYFVYGPITASMNLRDATGAVEGTEEDFRLGSKGVDAVGDADGDGFDDVLISTKTSSGGGDETGHVFLVSGPVSGELSAAAADATWEAASRYVALGTAMDGGDLDGDGLSDVILGHYRYDYPKGNSGAVFLWYGPVSGAQDLDYADFAIYGNTYTSVGRSALHVSNLLGTGDEDVVFRMSCSGTDCLGVVEASVSGRAMYADDADAVIKGRTGSGGFGDEDDFLCAGDLNGDGYPDLIAGGDEAGAGGVGDAYVLLGPLSGAVDAVLYYEAYFTADKAGNPNFIQVAGDVDGDGQDDLLFGMDDDTGGTSAGSAHLFYGPLSGRYDVPSGDVDYYTDEDRANFGDKGGGGADITGDGLDDALVTAASWGNSYLFILSPADL